MRKFIFLTLNLVFMIALTATAEAKTPGSKAPKRALPGAEKGQLGTNFSFDAASVHGKYQLAGQGVATVEDEKVLDDLLGIRKSFRDREEQEASRR